MSQYAQQNKVSRHNNGVTTLEHNTIVEESLLPPAEELKKLEDIKPGIIEWIRNMTEAELDARIEFNNDSIRLAKYDLERRHQFNFRSLMFGFILLLVFMGLSTYLITTRFNIVGSVFGNTTLVVAAVVIIRKPSNRDEKNQSQIKSVFLTLEILVNLKPSVH